MDMSQKPEGATHYVAGSCAPWEKRIGDTWFAWDPEDSEWFEVSDAGDTRFETESGMAPLPIEPAVTAPTLETMLTEWRDLEARAQAAQAEADALFEHAGQCHGEIVVRLAELGWGAPRMVPGEPVVTLDDDWWKNVDVGDMLTYRVGDGNYHRCDSFTDGQSYRVHNVDRGGDTKLPWEMWADGDDVYYWGSPDYFTPSTQP
jgi:hypothetical protein